MKKRIQMTAGIICSFLMFLNGCSTPGNVPVLTPAVETPAVTVSQTPSADETTAAPQVPAAEETPEPAPTPEPLLKQDVQGEKVQELQQRLIELGYLPEGKATGYFGTETAAAVKRFQQSASLAADGIAGEQTLAALYNEAAPQSTAPAVTGSLAGIRIGLDPGHQAKGNAAQEPVAPGASETKAKVSSGTQGVASGVAEYVVNLQVALKLRELLEAAGAEVIMTRESNDVNISNSERAQLMNNAGADLVVRLHCNGENDSSRTGAFILVPAGSYTKAVQAASRAAAEAVLPAFIASTGANNLGYSERSDQTGFNWSTVPVINIEMGHMSNAAEDQKLVSDSYQQLCAQGIADGLVSYFS